MAVRAHPPPRPFGRWNSHVAGAGERSPSHQQDLARALHSHQGHLSHGLRPLERPGFLVIGVEQGSLRFEAREAT
jgi:DNA-binding HxlR family transcriptional regulator